MQPLEINQLIPPEPTKTWTDVHEIGDTLHLAEIVDRREIEKTDKDGNPETIVAITGVDDLGAEWDVPLFRSDLKKAIPDAQVGSAIAFTYWGQQGKKFVYTHAAARPTAPVEESPPLRDADFMPDEENG